MKIFTLSTGDEVHRYQKSIVIPFQGERKVISTSVLNGGYQESIKAIFNHDANPGAGMACVLRTDSYYNDMRLVSQELGLDPESTTGISTAASMENVSIKTATFEDLTVTAIVTGGVEVNGGRVGDPAFYHEQKGKVEKIPEGTINIILYIDADLSEGTMARAVVTCTEAKTAALQELMAGSNYSRGLATGSGTDGTIVVANSQSQLLLTNAGKHSKLGELIGVTVKSAVKEALFLQSGLCPKEQHNCIRRLKRFGVSQDLIWEKYKTLQGNNLSKPEFIHRLEELETDGQLVTLTSLYVHLMDQLDWGLLMPLEVVSEGQKIIERIKDRFNVLIVSKVTGDFVDNTVECMIDVFVDTIARVMEVGQDV
ncbi:adenosylcobinamide amidohydrolase [Alkalibaculum bacchi]|uniref:adenosylcobinamide amidohydrolase n=1 Tax=Alkalibaculum bacchi TaxID=645887 RepID=UPI0026EB01A8|nr:adenosylcobinamide amidohydrolase [Alkalibaculum bacchi]